ncbi:DNA polymerase III gamma/tau subunit [Neobacillus cucumis]|nr:DNA polymerase III gamma/tau subunit [Neobacillus cucumis]
MELLIKQCDHNQSEEPCEKCTPKIEREETIDILEYDYYKRIWF